LQLLENPEASDNGFPEQRRRKRNSSTNTYTQQGDKNETLEQTAMQKTAQNMNKKVSTVRNYFAPLRTSQMEVEENEPPTEEQQQSSSTVSGRAFLIVLTLISTLINLQKQLKGTVKGNFQFHSTRNCARVVTR
jgi:hypothetical protein